MRILRAPGRILAALAVGVTALALASPASPASAATSAAPAPAPAPIKPVAKVDVARYLGTWKQIADLPQFYEAFCLKDVTAKYSLNSDGTVKVLNTCAGPIGTITTNGAAKVLDPGTNAQLQVSFLNLFGQQIFTGTTPNYVIIGLAPDYSWAVVGDPDHKSAYILSRTVTLTGAKLTAAKAALTASGYDPCSLTVTKQTGGATASGELC